MGKTRWSAGGEKAKGIRASKNHELNKKKWLHFGGAEQTLERRDSRRV